MKTFKIATRIEYFLAKVAGRDVDVSTLTPPVAANATEELLGEIADRLDDVEGGVPVSATKTKAGIVKMAANVPAAAGTEPTKAEFDALITALVNAGIMAGE